MRWWLVLCASVLWRSVTPRAAGDIENVSDQGTRKCCPCPPDLETAGNSPLSTAISEEAFGRGLLSLAYPDQESFGTSAAGSRAALDAAAVDDCPCRFRDADSSGSASVFFPTAMRAAKPFVSLEDEKEDTKPLLHPEVGLASSVLQTLREATEEDYNEALARDAARSESRSMEPDGIAEESRNLVTYVISPKQAFDDDVVPEASNMEEARAIDSLLDITNTRIIPSLINPPDLQTQILNKPLRNPSILKNIFNLDSSVSASNVNEDVLAVPAENELERSKENSKTDFSNILLGDRIKKSNFNIPKLNDFLKNVQDSVSGFTTTTNTDGKSTDESNILHKILDLIPNKKQSKLLKQNEADTEDDMLNSDNVNSPSNVVERYSGFASDSFFNTPKTKMTDKSTKDISPLNNFKNKIFGSKIPQLNLPLKGRDASSDLLSEVIKSLEKTGNLLPFNLFNEQRDIPAVKSPDFQNKEVENTYSILKDDKTISTEIIDTIPSSSSLKTNEADVDTLDCLRKTESVNTGDDNAVEETKAETEILDNLSNAGVNVIDSNEDSKEANVKKIPDKNFVDSNENAKEDDITETKIITHIPRNIDATNIDLELTSNVDKKEDTSIDENFQLDRENCFENKEDSLNEASSNVAKIASTERSDDTFEEPSFVRASSENFSEDFERSNSKSGLNIVDDATVIADSDNIATDNNNELTYREKLLQKLESLKVSPKITKTKEKSTPFDVKKEISNQLSIDDLQKMSNSLLDKEKILIDVLADRINKVTEPKTGINDESQIVSEESLETSKENLEAKDAVPSDTNSLNQMVNLSELECPSSPDTLSLTQTNLNDNVKEMASEASERVTNAVAPYSILKSSIFPNVVQPLPSLFNRYDNVFNRPIVNLPNIFNNPLPTLSSFRSSETKDKALIGNNLVSNDDSIATKDRELLPLASTSNYKSAFPPLQPLEDINLDFLQFKPLSLSQNNPLSGIPALPRLNLNSYKTKLALPKSSDLKPVLLESTIGNKKGMVGATVSFGKKKNGIGRKTSTLQKVPDILASPVVLPRFDDLRENFLEKAQDLLSTPLETSGRNMIEDTLRSGQVLTENLKVQAKNTVKDLKKNFEHSLKGAGLSSTNILGNPLTGSDLLEAVSLTHDDFGDKLKGIHQDFTDRLETLRNDILDQIPSLSSPMARQSSNIMTFKQPPRLSAKNNKNQLSLSRKTKKLPGKFKFGSPRTDKSKSLKMHSASSVLSSKFAENPQSITTLPDFSHLHSLKETPLHSKLGSINRPLLDILQNHKKPILSKPALKPKLKDSKVTITFSTTPRPDNLKFKPFVATVNNKPKLKSKSLLEKDFLTSQNNIKSKTGSKLTSIREPNVSPSELKATKIKAPVRVPIRSKPSTLKDVSGALPSTSSKLPLSSHVKAPILKNPLQIDEILRSVEDVVMPKTPLVPADSKYNFNLEPFKSSLAATRPLSWPRTIDNTFLTKVREAVKMRLAEIATKTAKPAKNIPLTKTEPAADMARSASNKVDIVVSPISETMTENTSYTCKMMCTKNT